MFSRLRPVSVNIRPAAGDDYEAVGSITVAAYLAAGHFDSAEHPYLLQIRDAAHRAEQAPIWVAERDGKVIGSVTLARAGDRYADIAYDDELEFRMLVVDPAVQRSGAGSALVNSIIIHARSLPEINAVSLTTGKHWESAHALYRSMGFTRVPERDWTVPGTAIELVVYRYPL